MKFDEATATKSIAWPGPHRMVGRMLGRDSCTVRMRRRFRARASQARSRAAAPSARSPVSRGSSMEFSTRPRGRGHRSEQLRLLTQDGQVADCLAAVGEQHRKVGQDPSGVMTGAAAASKGQDVAERCGRSCGWNGMA